MKKKALEEAGEGLWGSKVGRKGNVWCNKEIAVEGTVILCNK